MKSKKNQEEVIDMEEDDSGTFHPIVPYRRPNPSFPQESYQGKVPAMYQFLDGFILGLEAMENFVRNTRRLSRNWFDRRF
jgi:hypothetical protein